jgi:GTPase SAR1 family protein
MPYYVVVLGTAGSGKTTLAAALQDYIYRNGMDASIINLDPAVETLPYKPDVDVRDYVSARELMKTHGLGPNGALIAAVDMITLRIDELRDEVSSLKSNYIILDTPGQMELFAFRETGPIIIDSLINDFKAVSLFLIDILYASNPSNYFSALLLSASTHVRIGLPQINVLTKIDMVPEDIVSEIIGYAEDPALLASRIASDKRSSLIWGETEIENMLENLLVYETIPISSTKMIGYDNLYAAIQRIVAGGEDYYTEEPSERL